MIGTLAFKYSSAFILHLRYFSTHVLVFLCLTHTYTYTTVGSYSTKRFTVYRVKIANFISYLPLVFVFAA